MATQKIFRAVDLSTGFILRLSITEHSIPGYTSSSATAMSSKMAAQQRKWTSGSKILDSKGNYLESELLTFVKQCLYFLEV